MQVMSLAHNITHKSALRGSKHIFCFVSVTSVDQPWDKDILVQPQPYIFTAYAKCLGHSKLNKWSNMTGMHCRLLLSSINTECEDVLHLSSAAMVLAAYKHAIECILKPSMHGKISQ